MGYCRIPKIFFFRNNLFYLIWIWGLRKWTLKINRANIWGIKFLRFLNFWSKNDLHKYKSGRFFVRIFAILIFKLGKKSCFGKKIFWDFDNIPFCPKIDFRQNTCQISIKIFFFSRNEFSTLNNIILPNFIGFLWY